MEGKCSTTEEIKTAHIVSVRHPEWRKTLAMPRRRSEGTVERDKLNIYALSVHCALFIDTYNVHFAFIK